MTLAIPERTIPGELVPFTPPRRNPWARQEALTPPHPCATDRQTRQATPLDVWREDPGLRWLVYTGGVGVLVSGAVPGVRVPGWWLPVVACWVTALVKDWRAFVPVFYAQMEDGSLWVREVEDE